MEQPLSQRTTFAQDSSQEIDVKERFYRYFQGEVTGVHAVNHSHNSTNTV